MYKSTSLVAFLALCFSSYTASSQNFNYRSLLEQIVKKPEIIYKWPLTDFKLDKRNIGTYEEFLAGQGKPFLDSNILKQLIGKTITPDTTAWSDSDFKCSILVFNPAQTINTSSTISLLKTERCKKINRYVNLIKDYNSASTDNYSNNPRIGKISYYSRPVFDDEGNYSIVAYLLPKGQFAVYLYRFEANEWKYFGKLYAVSF
jgi:hypothetical protein